MKSMRVNSKMHSEDTLLLLSTQETHHYIFFRLQKHQASVLKLPTCATRALFSRGVLARPGALGVGTCQPWLLPYQLLLHGQSHNISTYVTRSRLAPIVPRLGGRK
jgi:hypothetical protein